MSDNHSGGCASISLLEALGLLFIGLKLGGIIDWSWWLVLAPFWGQLVVLLLVIVIAAIVFCCTD